MAPPANGVTPAPTSPAVPTDLEEAEAQPAPAPEEAAEAEPAPVERNLAPIEDSGSDSEEAAPAQAEAEETPAVEEPGEFNYGAWQRFHLVLGGGYNFGATIAPEAEPFHSAAQNYNGGSFFLQPSFSVFAANPSRDLPNGRFDLRTGLDFKAHFLTSPNEPGLPSTAVNAISIGLLVEANVAIHRHFGIGLNGNVGYIGFNSDAADVGAPFPAILDFDGGLNLGGQAFLHFWDGNIRLGGGVDALVTNFDIDTGPGNPPLQTGATPMWQIFAGLDVLGTIRSAQGHK